VHPLDAGLALFFPAPHSYTGEHLLELHGHGGPLVLEALIARALELGASALILVHNHPSGDPSPSRADIAMTKEVIAAARALIDGALDAEAIVRRSLDIASDICVYTNRNVTVEKL